MAKLPGIRYDAPVQRDAVETAGRPLRAAAGVADMFSKAVDAYAEETARTQQLQASAELDEQLERIKRELGAKKYFTAGEVRAALGDKVDELPPQVQQLMTRTDERGEAVDSDQVPSWAVAGHLFEQRSAAALEAASSGISIGPKAQGEFRLNAQRALVARRAAFHQAQLEEMDRFLQASQSKSILSMTNTAHSGADWAKVYEAIDGSNALPPEAKIRLREQAQQTQQTQPVHDALRTGSAEQLQLVRKELDDQSAFSSLSPEQRSHLARAVDGRLEAVSRLQDDVAVDREASRILNQSKAPGQAWVDAQFALDEARGLPADTPEQARHKAGVLRAVEHAVNVSDSLRERAAGEHLNQVRVYLQENGGNLSDPRIAPHKAWLLDQSNLSADKWDALESRLQREAKMRLREGQADRAAAAAARREQREADQLAKRQYELLRNEDMAKAAAIDVGATFGGASEVMRAEIAAKQAKDRKLVTDGGLSKWEETKRTATGEVEKIPGFLKDKERKAEFYGWLRDWQDQFQIDEKRPPTKVEVREALGKYLVFGAADPDAWVFKGKEQYRFQAAEGEAWQPYGPEKQASLLAKEALQRDAGEKPSPAPAAAAPAAPKKAAAIQEIRSAHPTWSPEQVSAELKNRGF